MDVLIFFYILLNKVHIEKHNKLYPSKRKKKQTEKMICKNGKYNVSIAQVLTNFRH